MSSFYKEQRPIKDLRKPQKEKIKESKQRERGTFKEQVYQLS